MGVKTGPLAPDPPHRSSVQNWPLDRRSPNQQLVSALASPELRARTSSIRQVATQLGLIPISWRKTGVANQVQAWVPAGTTIDWGDTGSDTPGTDSWVSHTYAGPGVYLVNATNVAMKALGETRIQV